MKNRFREIGEFYAAGLFEEPESSLFRRYSRGLRRYLENRTLPAYNGEPLYPCGSFAEEMCVRHHYNSTIEIKWEKLKEKDELAFKALKDFPLVKKYIPEEHMVGGSFWTHSYPNFGRIIQDGLDSYKLRIEEVENADIRYGLLDVIEGIKNFHIRALNYLKECGAEDSSLYKALEKVPFKPAESLYEAMVSWNFIYYMDGCDNIGRLDADLIKFYKGEDITDIIRCFFKNVDANHGWSGALGPDYNPLTIQCLNACKGIRRPSLELRITKDMPQEVWDAAIESIKCGGGSPSLYNEEGYQNALSNIFPDIPKEDLIKFCGGGCTETMLAGVSNVGSCDAGVNLALIFERVMREKLSTAKSFDEFYTDFINRCYEEITIVLDGVSLSQKSRAEYGPHPMRTLLIDDCIDNEKDFNNGGARYKWSIINIAGMINVLDSLSVIKKIVFTDRSISGEKMLNLLDAGERFLNYPNIERYGSDTEESNKMTSKFFLDICKIFETRTPYSGGKFLPSSIQFTTYVAAGKKVGATPDGRTPASPLCDSIGAIFGNDKSGLTAVLNSAAAIGQDKLIGTPVLNVKLDSNKSLKNLKALVNGYFKKGGLQMQITCVNKEDLLEAQKNPENYPNLIVRIGGFSEYFNKLTPELQQTVIERTFAEI